MKCAACYADNPPWQTVCTTCGAPAHPLQLCPAGRILAPGTTRCPDCPARWPEVDAFPGLPVLRGVLWADGARLWSADGMRALPCVELRDRETPLAFRVESPQRVLVLDGDPAEASVKLLVRPPATRYCLAPGEGKVACTGLEYLELPAAGLVVHGASLRFAFFEVPGWVEGK